MSKFLKLFLLSSFLYSSHNIYAGPLQPKQIEGVNVIERLGDPVKMDIPFVDTEGQTVVLRDYTKNNKPLIVMMGYYGCPKLCSLILDGIFTAARNLTWTMGKEYDFVMVSVDPEEDHMLARKKQESYARLYGRSGSENGMHFLTGKEDNIRKLAAELGFHYKYDEKIEQYVHPAVLTVLSTKDDKTKITRYLYGIDFPAKDVKLALVEGAEGRIGTIVERILLLCYQYDPTAGSYSVSVMMMMKVAGACTVLMIAFLIWFLNRNKRLAV